MGDAVVQPPRLAEGFLESLGAERDFADDVLGDLAEEFRLRARFDRARAARRWHYAQAFRTAPHLARDRRRRVRPRDAAMLFWPAAAGLVTRAVLRWFAARVTSWMTGISIYACAVHWKTRGDGALTTVMFAIGGMPLRLSSTLAATNAVRLSLSCFAGGVAAVVSLGRRRLRGVDELAREPNG